MREGSSPVELSRVGFRAALGFAVFDAASGAVAVAVAGAEPNLGTLIGALAMLAVCVTPLVFLLFGECTRNLFFFFGALTAAIAMTWVNVLVRVLVAPDSFFEWMLVVIPAGAVIGLTGNRLLRKTLNGDRSDE